MPAFLTSLLACIPKWIEQAEYHYNEVSLQVKPEHLQPVLRFLRDHTQTQFKVFIDLCGVDYPAREKRFEVVLHLLSVQTNARIRVKTQLSDFEAVPTTVDLFSAATWWERETWDLYGIFFEGNPDLRRLLTDYGFEGHPMRKDFPLSGFTEVRYDDSSKRVIYEPIELAQAFRTFKFAQPWDQLPKT